MKRILAVAALLCFATACSSGRTASRAKARTATARQDRDGDRPAPAAGECRAKYRKGTLDVPQSELQGMASYYAKQYHGRQTASGETFDMHALSAAHRTLLLGTRVRVTNMDNGRQVDVCINDRGPYAKHRVLDLSYAAAKELGIIDDGEGPVRIEILK